MLLMHVGRLQGTLELQIVQGLAPDAERAETSRSIHVSLQFVQSFTCGTYGRSVRESLEAPFLDLVALLLVASFI